jgi:predicted cupin superfamily sugar epimerase
MFHRQSARLEPSAGWRNREQQGPNNSFTINEKSYAGKTFAISHSGGRIADMITTSPDYWIKVLHLVPHPEGGWFAESYRAMESIPAAALPERFTGSRSLCTAIHFMLEEGQVSALHRLKSDEIWHFYAGDPLAVHVITSEGSYQTILLGSNPERGERFQIVVPAGCWFGSECSGRFALVGCTVAPGFDFADFEMARQSELTDRFPQHAALIARMTRL